MAESQICWRRWPLRERGWLRAGLVALLLVGLEVVLLVSLPPIVSLVMSLAFITLLLPYYLPAVYRIGSEGVQVQRSLFAARLQSWATFESFRPSEQGCWLIPTSTLAGKNRLPLFEPLRAVFLPYPTEPELKTSLLTSLQCYLPSP
ncbi:MAG: hypothetical protein WCS37_22450 [Chloroflexota bacterium]|nr:hypothetical protein [Chloroflexota bacterium]